MEISNKIYELACLYKNDPSDKVALEIKILLSDYIYSIIRLYAYKDTDIEKVFKKSFLIVLEMIKKYDFTSYEGLIKTIKIKLRTEIQLIIVGIDN